MNILKQILATVILSFLFSISGFAQQYKAGASKPFADDCCMGDICISCPRLSRCSGSATGPICTPLNLDNNAHSRDSASKESNSSKKIKPKVPVNQHAIKTKETPRKGSAETAAP